MPHERMFERAFVLVPLVEINDQVTEQLRSAHEALATIDIQKEGVVQWKKTVTVEEFVRSES